MLNSGQGPKQITERILDGIGVSPKQEDIIPAYGPCDPESLKQRMMRAVASLGKDEIRSIMEDEGKIEVGCAAPLGRCSANSLTDVIETTVFGTDFEALGYEYHVKPDTYLPGFSHIVLMEASASSCPPQHQGRPSPLSAACRRKSSGNQFHIRRRLRPPCRK